MNKRTLIIGVIVFIAIVLIAGSYVSLRLENTMNVPKLSELIQSQPDLMPGMELPVLGTMPEIEGIVAWINSEPLTKEDLKGKVVLVDFWTYSCINCIRTYPALRELNEKYKDEDFIILGIHTPEFEFEKNEDNVRREVAQNDLDWPHALDNDYVTWRNFKNRFWPAKYLFDKEGNLRYTHFGEGKYQETDDAIAALLGIENGTFQATETPDFSQIRSPETYFGHGRGERFATPESPVFDEPATYSFPSHLLPNTWALDGRWVMAEEYSENAEANGRFRFRYSAGKANIVMVSASGEPARVNVFLDGAPVSAENAGSHVTVDDTGSYVTITESDLYNLIDTEESGEHMLEIMVEEPGVQLYAITFGS